jgi:hypothetical protein
LRLCLVSFPFFVQVQALVHLGQEEGRHLNLNLLHDADFVWRVHLDMSGLGGAGVSPECDEDGVRLRDKRKAIREYSRRKSYLHV